jgi:hypothetical protein
LIIALGGHEGDERARNSSMILKRTFAARDESESLNPFKLVEAGD